MLSLRVLLTNGIFWSERLIKSGQRKWENPEIARRIEKWRFKHAERSREMKSFAIMTAQPVAFGS